MKYLEQRVEELEKEILKLKSKIIALECKHDHLYNCNIEDASKYINDYPPYPSVDTKKSGTIWCPLYPEIVGSWDEAPINQKDWGFPNPDYMDSSDLPTYYPPANSEDVLGESKNCPTDENEFKMSYDKMDKDFLEWLNTEKPFTAKSLFKDYKQSKDFDTNYA